MYFLHSKGLQQSKPKPFSLLCKIEPIFFLLLFFPPRIWLTEHGSESNSQICFIFSANDLCSPLAFAQTNSVISFSTGLPPATAACQKPEEHLTALQRSPQVAELADC